MRLRFALAMAVAAASAAATLPAAAREAVSFKGYSSGTIVIKTGERRLYLVLGDGHALRYVVGVGRAGKQWAGTSYINGKYIRPPWSPPAEVRRDKPSLPAVIPGGSPRNPMGAAAMTLSGGEYAIHGTNLRLYPHAQCGHPGPLRPRERRHHGRGDAIARVLSRTACIAAYFCSAESGLRLNIFGD